MKGRPLATTGCARLSWHTTRTRICKPQLQPSTPLFLRFSGFPGKGLFGSHPILRLGMCIPALGDLVTESDKAALIKCLWNSIHTLMLFAVEKLCSRVQVTFYISNWAWRENCSYESAAWLQQMAKDKGLLKKRKEKEMKKSSGSEGVVASYESFIYPGGHDYWGS